MSRCANEQEGNAQSSSYLFELPQQLEWCVLCYHGLAAGPDVQGRDAVALEKDRVGDSAMPQCPDFQFCRLFGTSCVLSMDVSSASFDYW